MLTPVKTYGIEWKTTWIFNTIGVVYQNDEETRIDIKKVVMIEPDSYYGNYTDKKLYVVRFDSGNSIRVDAETANKIEDHHRQSHP